MRVSKVLRLVDSGLRRRLGLLALAAIVASSLDALGVLLVIPLLEVFETGGDVDVPILGAIGPASLLVWLIGLFVGKSLLMIALRWWVAGVVLQASSRAATQLFHSLLDAPLAFHDRRNTADSVRTLMMSVRTFFEQGVIGVATLVAEAVTVAVLAAIVILRAPLAGVTTFAYFAVALVVFGRVVQRKAGRQAKYGQVLSGRLIQSVQEGFGALAELRVHRSTGYVATAFADRNAQLARSRRRVLFASDLSRYYLEIMFIGAVAVMVGVVLAQSSSTDALPTVALFLAVGFRVLPGLSRLLLSAHKIRVGSAALALVVEDLDAMDDIEEPTRSAEPGDPAPGAVRVRADQLGFRYPGTSADVLSGLDLRIEPGQTIGLVGASGSGKTTLLELICGLRQPSDGTLELSLDSSLAGEPMIGYAPQDAFTLDSTVKNNVALGRQTTDEQIWEALDRAKLGDFVKQMPDGLHSKVGEGGAALSGGQRQRLGLARAYLGTPGLLILDEATSALDTETEASVLAEIASIGPRSTVLLVTHRPSALDICHVVYSLQNGELCPWSPQTVATELGTQATGSVEVCS